MRVTRTTDALVKQVHEAIGADLGLIRKALENLERQEERSPHKLVRQIMSLHYGHPEEPHAKTIRRVLVQGDSGEAGSWSDYIIFIRDLILKAEQSSAPLPTKRQVKLLWEKRKEEYLEQERAAFELVKAGGPQALELPGHTVAKP